MKWSVNHAISGFVLVPKSTPVYLIVEHSPESMWGVGGMVPGVNKFMLNPPATNSLIVAWRQLYFTVSIFVCQRKTKLFTFWNILKWKISGKSKSKCPDI
jgi:hypothetical protein